MKNRYIYIICIFLCTVCINLDAQRRGSDVENRVLEAVDKYNDGDYAAAKTMLLQILEDHPQNDAAHYYLAMTSVAVRDLDAAQDHLRRAVELDSSNFWYRYRLAALYAVTSRPELAIDIYENLLKDFPKKYDVYYELVELYASQKELDKALEILDEIETVFGTTESLAVYRFNLLRMKGEQEDAYKSLEEYNSKYSSPYILSTLADWQMSMYNDSTALAYYNEALDLAPDYAPALLGKAETYRITRKFNEYFDVLQEYVSDPSTNPEGKSEYILAVIKHMDSQFIRSYQSKMDSVLQTSLEVHPTDSSLTNTAALWYYSTSRDTLACKYFKQNVENNPASLASHASLTEFLMYAQMWEELSIEGRKAFEKFPDEPAFLELASVGDYNLERYDKVMELCDKVLEVAPTDSSSTLRAWSTKGDIYYQLGERKKAYKAYDKALKVNPDYAYVLNNYAYYLSLEGKNLKKAYKMSSKTVEAEPDNATYLDTFGWILYLMGKPLEAKPFFKHAMLYGGKESAVIMDHYAEVLFALKEYDLAFVYWSLAKQKNYDGEIEDLDERINARKMEARK